MTADSWLVVVRSAPTELDSREVLELVLAGASLGIALNVVFAGPGQAHLSGKHAAGWQQLIDFEMADLWCLADQEPKQETSIRARWFDDAGFEQLRSQARGVVEP